MSEQLTREDIEEGLRRLGLGQGDAVEVHSSLSRFGKVRGGASTVVDSLMNVVGEDGTLVMSAYLVGPPVPLTEAERTRGITWKVRILDEDPDGRTGMGAVADELCRRPDVVLGTGLHRVCAWGHEAQQHSRGYGHLLQINGWVLLMGVDINRCSSMHLARGIPEEIERIFKVPEDIQSDYPADEWGIGYGSTPDDAWPKVQEEAGRKGLIKLGHIGRAECMLFKAKDMVTLYEELLRKDPFGLFGVE